MNKLMEINFVGNLLAHQETLHVRIKATEKNIFPPSFWLPGGSATANQNILEYSC